MFSEEIVCSLSLHIYVSFCLWIKLSIQYFAYRLWKNGNMEGGKQMEWEMNERNDFVSFNSRWHSSFFSGKISAFPEFLFIKPSFSWLSPIIAVAKIIWSTKKFQKLWWFFALRWKDHWTVIKTLLQLQQMCNKNYWNLLCEDIVLFLVIKWITGQINSFHATGLFLYPLKTSENLFDVCRGYRKRPVPWNRLLWMSCSRVFFEQH